MKKSNINNPTNFYHKSADALIAKRVPEIEVDIETFASDLAHQARPSETDTAVLFMPKIKSFYEVLLESVFKLIGAFALLNQSGTSISDAFEREKKALKKKQAKLNEKARILKKDIKGLTDISHIINKWRYKWRLVLIALSVAEVAVNYKILLIVTPNQITALVASLGLCTVLFITAHSFKDILAHFKTRAQKWGVGIGITLFVLALLYNLNRIRLSYMQNEGQVTSDISEWSFVIINMAMFLAGTIIAVLYKPLKSDIAKNVQYNKVKNELKGIELESKKITDRLTEIPKEQDEQMRDSENLKYMALHYQNMIISHYHSGVALFKSENLFRRVDGVNPKCFEQQPPKLKTYFGLTETLGNRNNHAQKQR